MKHLTSYIQVGLTIATILCASCAGNGSKYPTDLEIFACDSSFAPVIEEVREIFQDTYGDIDTCYTDESSAIRMLVDGQTYLAITSRDMRPDEKEGLKQKFGWSPRVFKIGYDGMALIQNNANTDSCISVNDIKRILLGEVTDWKEIYPDSKLGKITLVFDNPTSSTVHFAEDSILGGKPISNTNAIATRGAENVIRQVEQHKGAIGIIGSNWLNDKRDTTNITFRKDIRVMAVSKADIADYDNSYLPYQGNFYYGDYPLVRTLYIWLNEPKNGKATMFKNFTVSQNQGQIILLKAGILPAYGRVNVVEVNVSER